MNNLYAAKSRAMTRFLRSVARDQVFRRNAEDKIIRTIDEIDSGRKFSGRDLLDPVYTIARARVSIRKKYSRWNELYMDDFSASYSTPEIIGKYRAERIDREVLDTGSGAGMQAIMFGLRKRSTGIEIDQSRFLMSQLNAEAYSSDVEFRNIDVYDFSEKYDGAVFSDPLRDRSGGSESLVPSPYDLLKKFPRSDFAFDLPPKMETNRINIEGEREYISINGYLSRLTLYTGSLKRSGSSAHIFPADVHIGGDYSDVRFDQGEAKKYIYVPDEALVYAGLLEGFSQMNLIDRDRRRTVLSSDEELRDFPGTVYSIMDECSHDKLSETVRKINPEDVLLRYSVDPNDYYRITQEMKNEGGNGTLYIFRSGESYYIAEMIADINGRNRI